MKSRPWPISIFSLLLFFNAAFYAVLAALSLVNRPALAAVLQALSPGGAGPADVHLAMGKFLPFYYVTFTFVTVGIGMGFWRLWNWARVVVLGLIGLSLAMAVPEALNLIRSGGVGGTALFLLRIGVGVLIGWYLLSSKVRSAFRSPAASVAIPEPQR
jgi:hypothetical protein